MAASDTNTNMGAVDNTSMDLSQNPGIQLQNMSDVSDGDEPTIPKIERYDREK